MFANLHTHTDYSILDGMMTVTQAFTVAKDCKYSALAITEHGNLSSMFPALSESIRQDIRYIPGIEFFFRDSGDGGILSHLVVLASNHMGLKSIMKLSYISYGHDTKNPYITWNDLGELDRDGVIVLSGCQESLLGKRIMFLGEKHGSEVADKFLMYFGDRYYIEINTPFDDRQRSLNDVLLSLAQTKGIRPVVTLDSHYATADKKKTFPVWLAIQHKGSVHAKEHMFYNRHHLLREGEIKSMMTKEFYPAIETSHAISLMCDDPREYLKASDQFMMPRFDVESMNNFKDFREWRDKYVLRKS